MTTKSAAMLWALACLGAGSLVGTSSSGQCCNFEFHGIAGRSESDYRCQAARPNILLMN